MSEDRVSYQIAKGAPAPTIGPVLLAAINSRSTLSRRVSLRMSTEVHEALEELAYDSSSSIAAVIGTAIHQYLEAEYRKGLKEVE